MDINGNFQSGIGIINVIIIHLVSYYLFGVKFKDGMIVNIHMLE